MEIQGIPVEGAPVQRGGSYRNFTTRLPERLLLDIERLARVKGASKNGIVLWLLNQVDMEGLADLAEEHGDGAFRVEDIAAPPKPLIIEEQGERVEWAETLRFLVEHREQFLAWRREHELL